MMDDGHDVSSPPVLKNELQKTIQYKKTYKRRNQGDQHPKFFKDLKVSYSDRPVLSFQFIFRQTDIRLRETQEKL